MKVGKLGWLVAMFLSGGMAVAQGTADDYRRAYALKEKFSADKVFYSNVNPQWIEGTHQFRVCAEYAGRPPVCICRCG